MDGKTKRVDIDSLRRVVEPWCAQTGARLCVLFGSQATGRARVGSDLDLAAWPSPPGSVPDPDTQLTWWRDVQSAVDHLVHHLVEAKPEVNLVIVTPRLDPVLGREIARDGLVLFESEENLWHWERLRLIQLFRDALPFIRAERESLRRYAEEVREHGA